MADPPDYTERYNTSLSSDDEARFKTWLAKSGRQNDLFDYDLRGAWKANTEAASNGHLPDTWKKPNHPTFSQESQYSGVSGDAGGKWEKAANGQWVFLASEGNLANLGANGMMGYFKESEPDSTLILPDLGPGSMQALNRIFQRP